MEKGQFVIFDQNYEVKNGEIGGLKNSSLSAVEQIFIFPCQKLKNEMCEVCVCVCVLQMKCHYTVREALPALTVGRPARKQPE